MRFQSTAPPAGDPGAPALALAMIVRDGGQLFASLLREAAPFVDEMVIGDTGSEDGSDDAARQAGATVLAVPWTDDFAAARNAVNAACRARWILSLDADERLAPGDWDALRDWVRGPGRAADCAGRLLTRNYLDAGCGRRHWRSNPDPDAHALPEGAPAAGFVPTAKVRLFPNLPGLGFQGRLHETVEESLADLGLPVRELPWPVHHFGLLQEDPLKAGRYLRLARRKTQDRPHDAGAWAELADCAVACRQLEEALAAIDRSLVLEPAHPDRRLTAGWLLKRQGRLDQADLQLRAAAGAPAVTDAVLAEACHLRAQIALLQDRSAEAAVLLAVALRLTPDNGHYLNTLGALYLQRGRGEEARRALEHAHARIPRHPDPLLNLGLMYEAAGHRDLAVVWLQRALQTDPQCTKAAAALARLGLATAADAPSA